ncbi:MAG: biotin--[acetyl-CoA-carboxylase] ligase [Longimicrobiales bacterium]|nr:biotin--[acetyl-CoA-carboxylase] ligase [Longimicrobiales bacterium]
MVWEGRTAEAWVRRLGLAGAEFHPVLPSTSNRARERALAGNALPWLVLADAQTAGRGRSGRDWTSPPGAGIWCTLVLPARDPAADALLPLRVGAALAPRLEGLARERIRLKWPNDLFLGEPGTSGKVGGVLCERFPLPGSAADSPREAVAVGVGLNVHPVTVPDRVRVAHLGLHGPLDRGTVLEAVAEAVLEAARAPSATLSAPERARWEARDLLRGRRVRVEGWGAPHDRGRVRGIDGAGRLLVERGSDVVPVAAGAVVPEDPI